MFSYFTRFITMISSSFVIFNVLFLFTLTYHDEVNSYSVVSYGLRPIDQSWKTFRCKDGRYIHKSYFCAKFRFYEQFEDFTIEETPSCEDKSHLIGCDEEKCGPDKFKCTNGTCVDVDDRCNTKKDCPDDSDELNCGDEVNVQNCSLADGKFLCKDKLRCLDFELACNKDCNCFDCSDENENCTVYDEKMNRKCPNAYFSTPNGPKCFCGSDDPKMNNLCKEVKPCPVNESHVCSQKCFQYKDKIVCSCYDDYFSTYTSSGHQCLYKAYYDNLLAYSTSNQIKVINFTAGQTTVVKKNFEFGVLTGTQNYLYYTAYDDDRKTINKISISTKQTNTIVKSNSSVFSIAIDYITNNIYYTTNESLSVCNQNGCLILKCCNVRHVALAPKFGLMFYMKKGDFQQDRFIMKSGMDGSKEEYLVDGGFKEFSPLAVDESTRKVYWAQYEANEIWCLPFDNTDNAALRNIQYKGQLMYFTVLDSELIFTKERDNEIYSIKNIERYTKTIKAHEDVNVGRYYVESSLSLKRIALSDKNATRWMDNNVTFSIKFLHAYNPTWQKTFTNPCTRANCIELCLLHPNARYTCQRFNKLNEAQTVSPRNNHTLTEHPIAAHESESSSKEEPSHSHWLLITIGLTIMALVVFASGIYVGFSKRLFLRNWKSNRDYDI